MKKILIGLIVIMALVNLIAVFGPEVGFDALWYQLTLPKLWLLKHQWFFEGGLLYYSPMPRLGGLLFLPLMYLWGESGAKLLQFACGIASTWIVFRIARIKFDLEKSLFSAACFYITNIVSWQSGSAYIDLIRTFFEVIGFYFAVSDTNPSWLSRRKFFAGVAVGLAVGTKWQALVTLMMMSVWFSPLIFVVGLITAAPWMLVAYHFTANPIYPVFETFMSQIQAKEVGPGFYKPLNIILRIVSVPWQFVRPFDDHTNPALMGVILLATFVYKDFRSKYDRSILWFCLGGLLIWQIIPPPSTRYYLPYLPYLALLVPYVIRRFDWFRYLLLISFVVVIFVRIRANTKFLPYLLSRETKEEFLVKNIGRLPGTFVDKDQYVKNNLPNDKRYLIDGFHNLYYFPFDFDHTSWAKNYENYDYLITNKEPVWNKNILIYENDLGTKIYKKPSIEG